MKAWQHILLGVLLGLILAAAILLVIQSPDGAGIELLPAPTRSPMVVHVAGAVGNPGVYELEPSSRVIDAINAAGGFTQEADRNGLNLADLIHDGSMITVPVYHEISAPINVDETISNLYPSENAPLNINTAGQSEIEKLPEIGQIKAADIIAYRDDNGLFSTIEDIMDVPGIGPVIFEKLNNSSLLNRQGYSMDTKQKLEAALRDAMRSGDDLRKRTIRLALSSIKMAEIDGGSPLDDNRQLAILQKELKTREELIQSARSGGRSGLIEIGQSEMNVLKEFMPAQLSDDEIRKLVQAAIEETSVASPVDMGKVMKQVLPKIGGRATSSKVSEMVKILLNERL